MLGKTGLEHQGSCGPRWRRPADPPPHPCAPAAPWRSEQVIAAQQNAVASRPVVKEMY